MYPVSSVVNVIPSWALDRWVEVIFRAPITGPSRFSPRSRRVSRSCRSRLTSANSEATNSPVPTVSTKPTPSITHSFTTHTS